MTGSRIETLHETVTLTEAGALIKALATEESILLLSPPGIGKSQMVQATAAAAGLICRSLLGTQIASEDVSGIPRIVGERSVFCPPRVLLPETPEPFCLFLDELPASQPDVQKAFYSLLLERRLGEHRLPAGTWVVAAGNRVEDRALVRALSSALVNRVFILQVRVDFREWIGWARGASIHPDVIAFVSFMPEALMRPVPADPLPFSTPRAWASLANALTLVGRSGVCGERERRALAFGRVSAPDAAVFCAMAGAELGPLRPPLDYLQDPGLLPAEDTARWFILSAIRALVGRPQAPAVNAEAVNGFLMALPPDHRFAVMVGLVPAWGRLGAAPAMIESLREIAEP
jgi:hypothetical protein